MITLFTNKKNANKSELTKEKNCQVRLNGFTEAAILCTLRTTSCDWLKPISRENCHGILQTVPYFTKEAIFPVMYCVCYFDYFMELKSF